MQPRIIIADEYPVVLYGAEHALICAGWRIALTTSKPAQLPSLLGIVSCELLIVDPFQSGEMFTTGMSLLGQLRRAYPDTRVVVFTEACSACVVRELERHDIHALVCKGDGTGELVAAVHQVTSGKKYISSSVASLHPALCPQRASEMAESGG